MKYVALPILIFLKNVINNKKLTNYTIVIIKENKCTFNFFYL